MQQAELLYFACQGEMEANALNRASNSIVDQRQDQIRGFSQS